MRAVRRVFVGPAAQGCVDHAYSVAPRFLSMISLGTTAAELRPGDQSCSRQESSYSAQQAP